MADHERALADAPPARAPVRASPLVEGPVLPTLLRLGLPNTVATVTLTLPVLVEAWRIGQLGGVALAGLALVFPLFMLSTMLSSGAIGGAVSGAVARALGAGDRSGAEAIARSAVVVALAGGLLMTALVLGLGRQLFAALGGSGPVLDVAWAYAGALFPWIWVVWLFNMLAGVLRGAGDMVRPLVAIVVVTSVHLLASGPVILHTDGGGVVAAAHLLAASYGVGLVVILAFLLRPGARVRLRAGRIDWRTTGRIVAKGLLAGSQSVLTIATSLIVTAFAARFGPEVLAGYGIGARIELLMVPLIFGVGGAAIAVGGASAGAGLRARAVRTGWTAAAVAAAIVGTIGVLLALTATRWAPAFSADPAVASVTIAYIEQVGPFYALFAVGLTLYFASQGLGTLLYPVLGTVVRLVVVLVGGALVFAHPSPSVAHLFVVVAMAMAAYGLFNALSLGLGPWRDRQSLGT